MSNRRRSAPCHAAGNGPAVGLEGGRTPTPWCPRGDTLHTHTAEQGLRRWPDQRTVTGNHTGDVPGRREGHAGRWRRGLHFCAGGGTHAKDAHGSGPHDGHFAVGFHDMKQTTEASATKGG